MKEEFGLLFCLLLLLIRYPTSTAALPDRVCKSALLSQLSGHLERERENSFFIYLTTHSRPDCKVWPRLHCLSWWSLRLIDRQKNGTPFDAWVMIVDASGRRSRQTKEKFVVLTENKFTFLNRKRAVFEFSCVHAQPNLVVEIRRKSLLEKGS